MNNAIAKKLILESQEVGPKEMSIRRTNSGIAGSIATKVSNREIFGMNDGYSVMYSLDDQAERLAKWLDMEEIEYAAKNW